MEQVVFSRLDVDDLTHHFHAPTRHIPLTPIRTHDAYEAAVGALNGLIEACAGEACHPLAPLLDVIGERIAAYDDAHHALPDATPGEALALLMEQHGPKQRDLPEIGSQGVVSEILSGRRVLNVRQIRRLAERFHVDPATFL